MSNIFQEVLTDAKGVEEKYLGPAYPYWQNIKSPDELGMSTRGSLQTMAKDIDGLIQYVEVLVTGKSNASKTGGPLGNKFFLKTGGKCIDKTACSDAKDSSTCPKQDRYIYINNIPEGNIPFISSGMGENFSDFKGLIPGTISNLNVLNPYAIMQSFLSGATPPCQSITLQTVDNNNNQSTETHYLALVDIQNMDPCSFMNRQNPITNKKCKETFENLKKGGIENSEIPYPEDVESRIFLFMVGLLGIYIIYCLVKKKK
jgi:hypothetical protein